MVGELGSLLCVSMERVLVYVITFLCCMWNDIGKDIKWCFIIVVRR